MISPLYGQLSPLRVPTSMRFISNDADVVAYVLAVEAADGQRLENGVISAYDSFITGCKTDGIWSAIKASCILAGARTLSGALVPLVGSAPTNNNFVSGDYNRETGLIGNSSTKYLDSNRSADSDSQNDVHISANVTSASGGTKYFNGYFNDTPYNLTGLITSGTGYYPRLNNSTATLGNPGGGNSLGLFGASRSSGSSYKIKSGTGSIITLNVTSSAPSALNQFVFAINDKGSAAYFHGARISFYSIGEHLDLAALNTRVSTLMTDIAAAI